MGWTAEWYDLIRGNRNYESEVGFFEYVFKEHGNVKSVLDIGCGTGMHAKYLSERGYSVTGIDRDTDMIRIAMKNAPKAEFIKADMRFFSAKRKFDAILCVSCTINYNTKMEDVYRTLKNANSMLTEGGLIIIEIYFGSGYLKKHPILYRFNSEGKRYVFSVFRTSHLKGRVFSTDVFAFVNSGGKIKKKFYNEKIAEFSNSEIKNAMKKAGFRCYLYERYKTKRYSLFKRNRGYPVFVGKKV